jgi:hypothetical protein
VLSCAPDVLDASGTRVSPVVRCVEVKTNDVLKALTEMLGDRASGYHVTRVSGPYDRLGRFLTLTLEPADGT